MISLKDVFKRKDSRNIIDPCDNIIDCRECDSKPNIFSSLCLRCCSDRLSDGDSDDIIFRSSADIQFRGESAHIIRRLITTIPNSCNTLSVGKKGCIECPLSKGVVIDTIWADLSIEGIDSLMASIDDVTVDCESYEQCKGAVTSSLKVLRDDLSSLMEEMSFVANRIVGV